MSDQTSFNTNISLNETKKNVSSNNEKKTESMSSIVSSSLLGESTKLSSSTFSSKFEITADYGKTSTPLKEEPEKERDTTFVVTENENVLNIKEKTGGERVTMKQIFEKKE